MNIIRVVSRFTLPRLDTRSLAERLAVMPAVVVTGARQTGKSTLAQELTPGDRRFFTLDDLIVRDAARRDPEVLAGGSRPVTLYEVQRDPELLHAVKLRELLAQTVQICLSTRAKFPPSIPSIAASPYFRRMSPSVRSNIRFG